MADTSREAVEAWGVPAVQVDWGGGWHSSIMEMHLIPDMRAPTGDAWFVRADVYAALLEERHALKAERDHWQATHAAERLAALLAERARDAALARAEAAEAEVARLRAGLQSIVECHAIAAEIYVSDTEMAENFRDRAKSALEGWDARWGLEQVQAFRAARAALGEPQP